MKRKLLITLFLTILLLFLDAFGTADLADDKKFTIFLNSKPLVLNDPVLVKNGTIMLPVKNILDVMHAHTDYYEHQKKLNCYYNNSFAKLFIDRNFIYINGNKHTFREPVTLIDGKTYAPLKFHCDFLHLDERVQENKIELTSRFDTEYVYLNAKLNREYKFEELGLSIALPEGWSYLKDSYFGIDNPYEKYGFKIKITNDDSPIDPDSYLENLLRSEHPSNEFNVINTSKSKLVTDNRNFYVQYYSIEKIQKQESDDWKGSEAKSKESGARPEDGLKDRAHEREEPELKHHAHYLCVENGKRYEFHFAHSKNTLKHQVLQDFEHSLSSLKLPPYDVSTVYEHYIEYPRLSELGFLIKSKLHSSMEIHDKFRFAGTTEDPERKNLYVLVNRNKQKKLSVIRVDESGKFESLIYAPFGIGKHNVKLFRLDENAREEILLQFNIVNLSAKNIYYLVPGEFVRPDASNVKQDLEQILKERDANDSYMNDYQVALKIFEATARKVAYHPSTYFAESEPKSADTLDIRQGVSSVNANIYLCSLMRSAEIPCRLIQGENIHGKHLYTECMISGSWRVFDLDSQVLKKEQGDAYKPVNPNVKITKTSKPIEVLDRFYYIDSAVYQEFFDRINYLDY